MFILFNRCGINQKNNLQEKYRKNMSPIMFLHFLNLIYISFYRVTVMTPPWPSFPPTMNLSNFIVITSIDVVKMYDVHTRGHLKRAAIFLLEDIVLAVFEFTTSITSTASVRSREY